MRAVDNDHVEVVKPLCETGADLEIQDGQWITALCAAVDGNKMEVAQVLMEAGANPNSNNTALSAPISITIEENNHAMARLLLSGVMDDENKSIELHYAVADGKEEFVKILLERGADRVVVDVDGVSARERELWRVGGRTSRRCLPTEVVSWSL